MTTQVPDLYRTLGVGRDATTEAIEAAYAGWQARLSTGEPISTQEWEQLILKDLKGADYAKKLIWTGPEGIPVKPYYRAEDLEGLGHLDSLPGQFPFVRGNSRDTNNWLIRQDVLVEDCGKAAAERITPSLFILQ